LALFAARCTPRFIKDWVHRHRFVDRVSRKLFSGVVGMGNQDVRIESGPMEGMRLATSEHISHAHIRGTYELDNQMAIDRVVYPGFICYDVGASIGYLSLLMARKAKHVYSFEPAPHAVAEIRKHIQANGLQNITIVPSPVSDREREVEFSLTDNAYGSAISHGETKWPTLKLKTITLDDFVAAHEFPDFIKLDVEGEEGRALEGARSILQKRKTVICAEIHNEEAAATCRNVLNEFGYQLTDLEGKPIQEIGPIAVGETHVLAIPG
jgi:FkbM family methyltransferase